MKRTFIRILALALCVTLAAGTALLPVDAHAACDHVHETYVPEKTVKPLRSPAPAGWSCENGHDFQSTGNVKGWDCEYGAIEYVIYTCTRCGASYHTAIRKPEGDGSYAHGTHDYQTYTLGGCSNNPSTQVGCSKCDYLSMPAGGSHSWSENVEKEPSCSEEGLMKRSCGCGAEETYSIPKLDHTYGEATVVPAACENGGYIVKTCQECGFEYRYNETPALGHKWVAVNENDESEGMHCDRCGALPTDPPTGDHTWSGWRSDADGHWLVCLDCRLKSGQAPHTDSDKDYKCDVCGYALPRPEPTCPHEWKVTGKNGTFNHYEHCDLCGATRSVSCAAAGQTPPRTYCTDPTYCVCGNIVADGQKRHNFGTWNCTDSTHEHHCLNRGCQYTEGGSHTYASKAGTVKCTTCGFVDRAASKPHEHTFGAWTVGADGCVRRCTDPSCPAMETVSHVAGAADCAGHAVCVNCGAAMTVAPSAVHTGATEIRNAAPAQVGKDGYTGDTYCLNCGRIISEGQVIEALKPDHVHEYAAVKHDASGHWMECECGAKEDEAAHSFVDGICPVCGEEEPVKAEEEHIHSYAAGFTADGTCHWHVCTVCGEEAEREEHMFVDGRCVSCGRTCERVEVREACEKAEEDLMGQVSVTRVFQDLSEAGADAYYLLPVQRLYNAGIMKGTSDTTFDAVSSISRWQVMVIMARLQGETDADPDDWSQSRKAYMEWANAAKITVDGPEEGAATREETVYMLWVMAGAPESVQDLSGFADFGEVDSRYEMAIRWAVERQILLGDDLNNLKPDDSVARRDAATLIARYIDAENIVI